MLRLSIAVGVIWCLSFTPITAQSNSSGTAIYGVFSNSNFIEKADIPTEYKEMMKEFTLDKKQILLSVSFDSTMHQSKGMDEKDDTIQSVGSIASAHIDGGLNCYNPQKKTLLQQESIGSKEFIIAHPIDLSVWEFTNEVKEIKGYQVKKAKYIGKDIQGEKIATTVWYAEKSNISVGPNDYVGFPGLVVLVESEVITYELLNINSIPIEVTCEMNGDIVTQQEFYKKEKAYFQNKKGK